MAHPRPYPSNRALDPRELHGQRVRVDELVVCNDVLPHHLPLFPFFAQIRLDGIHVNVILEVRCIAQFTAVVLVQISRQVRER